MMSSSSPLAVSMMTGIRAVAGSALSSRQTSSPDRPGSIRSSRIRSGLDFAGFVQPVFAGVDAGRAHTLPLQVVLQQFGDVFFVLDDQDVFSSHDLQPFPLRKLMKSWFIATDGRSLQRICAS